MPYQSVQSYISSLPNGLQSYPHARVKASVFSEFGKGYAQEIDLAQLPTELAALHRNPPTTSGWVPLTFHMATILARVEQNQLSLDDYLQKVRRQTQQLFAQPTYRLMVMVASPSILLRGAASRFNMFHEGIHMTSRAGVERSWELTMAYPRGILPELAIVGYGATCASALECGGSKDVRYELINPSPSQVTYRLSWAG